MNHLKLLLRKYDEDELFRRLTVSSPTWSEMIAEAIMSDQTGDDYKLATHAMPSIDLVAESGNHVQVKTVGTRGSLAAIHCGRDNAAEVMIIATFGEHPRFFRVPMADFKRIARTYDYPERNDFSWEISGSRISKGELDAFELAVDGADVIPL